MILPEAFIWHVFNSVASALVYCKHGIADGSENKGWEEILCGDIKEHNVLLGGPDDTEHELYPRVVLADFGMLLAFPPSSSRFPDQ